MASVIDPDTPPPLAPGEWLVAIGATCELYRAGQPPIVCTLDEVVALYAALGRSPTVRRLAAPRGTVAAAERARERADTAEVAALRAALAKAGGNVGAAAEALGIPRRTLDRRIAAAGLREWLAEDYPTIRRPHK